MPALQSSDKMTGRNERHPFLFPMLSHFSVSQRCPNDVCVPHDKNSPPRQHHRYQQAMQVGSLKGGRIICAAYMEGRHKEKTVVWCCCYLDTQGEHVLLIMVLESIWNLSAWGLRQLDCNALVRPWNGFERRVELFFETICSGEATLLQCRRSDPKWSLV